MAAQRRSDGIGIDEKTAVLMESDGTAWVTGLGAAYFLRPPGPPEQCTPNRPVTYLDIAVYRLKAALVGSTPLPGLELAEPLIPCLCKTAF